MVKSKKSQPGSSGTTKVERKRDACSKVVTLPQYGGTCWFNALMMATLYSQRTNKMLRRVKHLWKSATDQRAKRAYKIIEQMVMKFYNAKTQKDREKAYEYFSQVTPEHILETLHMMAPTKFKFNPAMSTGFNAVSYAALFLKFLGVQALILRRFDRGNGNVVYNVSKHHYSQLYYNNNNRLYSSGVYYTNDQLKEILDIKRYDVIIVVNDDQLIGGDIYNQRAEAHLKVVNSTEGGLPTTVQFHDHVYELDACVLASFHSDTCIGHEIAGITCNNRRYMYNGWHTRTHDVALDGNEEIKNRMPYPCELMQFDWVNDTDDFCLSAAQCGYDKEEAKKLKGLCFSFSKGARMYLYVNKDFAQAKFKLPANEPGRVLMSPGRNEHLIESHVIKHNPILQAEFKKKWDDKQRLCVRKVANWSSVQSHHRFDKDNFDTKQFNEDMNLFSPKLKKLLDTIVELDNKDMQEYGHVHKHFIFSDVGYGYGAKIVASGLLTYGFKLAYDKTHAYQEAKKEDAHNRFALLSSSVIYEKSMTQASKKKLFSVYNSRPDNVYGEKLRIIILDSGFKEGIDLFDVKYVHIFEPQVSVADQRQVIGRATRTCGQKGLRFDPQRGWPLEVRIYDSQLPSIVRERKFDVRTLHELYLSKGGIDIRYNNFAADLEKLAAQGAVDAKLNKAIHEFSVDKKTKQGRKARKDVVKGGAAATTASLQSQVLRKYGKTAKWVVNGLENLCEEKKVDGAPQAVPQAGTVMEFTPTQEFIRNYVSPTMPTNGILAYHSVGVGKTCSAIAAASTSFEPMGYTVLWVTRTTLKADMWKNMFDQICNVNLHKYAGQMPKEADKRRRLLSKTWAIPPMSYKQFTNMLLGKNDFYKRLVAINGKEDPLRKTLLIIDEAHKLFNAEDLSSIEKPDIPTLYKMLRKSYAKSGKDAVKLLLMTATPITNDPMDFIRMLNLFMPEDAAFPGTFDDFAARFLDEKTGKFTKDGAEEFLLKVDGLVSYINRERDARQFSQPVILTIDVPISTRKARIESEKYLEFQYNSHIKQLRQQIAKDAKRLKEIKDDLKEYKARGREHVKALQDQLKAATDKEAKKDLREKINQMKEKNKLGEAESQQRLKIYTAEHDILKKELSVEINDKRRAQHEMASDYSQERMITACLTEKNDKKSTGMSDHTSE